MTLAGDSLPAPILRDIDGYYQVSVPITDEALSRQLAGGFNSDRHRMLSRLGLVRAALYHNQLLVGFLDVRRAVVEGSVLEVSVKPFGKEHNDLLGFLVSGVKFTVGSDGMSTGAMFDLHSG